VLQDFLLLSYVRGRSLLDGNPAKAAEEFGAMNKKADAAGWPKYVFLANVGMGLSTEKLGNREQARKHYADAAAHVDSIVSHVGEGEKAAVLEGEEIMGVKHRLPYDRLAALG
jgi:hypothetical protein